MILVSSLAGLFGPFSVIDLTTFTDRAVCDGAHVPYIVVGECYALDIPVPYGRAEDFDLIDGVLVPKTP